MNKKIIDLSTKLKEQADLVLSLTDECSTLRESFEAEDRKLVSANERIRRAKEDTFAVSDVCQPVVLNFQKRKRYIL